MVFAVALGIQLPLISMSLPPWAFAAVGLASTLAVLWARAQSSVSKTGEAILTRALELTIPITIAGTIWSCAAVALAAHAVEPKTLNQVESALNGLLATIAWFKPSKLTQFALVVVVSLFLTLIALRRPVSREDREAAFKKQRNAFRVIRIVSALALMLASFGLVGDRPITEASEFLVRVRQQQQQFKAAITDLNDAASKYATSEVISSLVETNEVGSILKDLRSSDVVILVSARELYESPEAAGREVYGSPKPPADIARELKAFLGRERPSVTTAPSARRGAPSVLVEDTEFTKLESKTKEFRQATQATRREWSPDLVQLVDKGVDLAESATLKQVVAEVLAEVGGLKGELVKLVADYLFHFPIKQFTSDFLKDVLGKDSVLRLRDAAHEFVAKAQQQLERVKASSLDAKKRLRSLVERAEEMRRAKICVQSTPTVRIYGVRGCPVAAQFEESARKAGAIVKRFDVDHNEAALNDLLRNSRFSTGCPIKVEGGALGSVLIKINDEAVFPDLNALPSQIQLRQRSFLNARGVAPESCNLLQR